MNPDPRPGYRTDSQTDSRYTFVYGFVISVALISFFVGYSLVYGYTLERDVGRAVTATPDLPLPGVAATAIGPATPLLAMPTTDGTPIVSLVTAIADAQTITPEPGQLSPTSAVSVTVTVLSPGLNMRAGPGQAYTSIQVLPNNARLQAIGRSADGLWLLVEPDGQRGWIIASRRYLRYEGDLTALPVVEEPTAAPTAR